MINNDTRGCSAPISTCLLNRFVIDYLNGWYSDAHLEMLDPAFNSRDLT